MGLSGGVVGAPDVTALRGFLKESFLLPRGEDPLVGPPPSSLAFVWSINSTPEDTHLHHYDFELEG